jgi:magnesium transporter
MLTVYECANGRLAARTSEDRLGPGLVWIDLLNPTAEEEQEIESLLAIDVPTRAELREIEASSRFYEEDGAIFMTSSIIYNIEDPVPATSTITFILKGNTLVTVRDVEPRSFQMFTQRAERGSLASNSGQAVLIGLFEVLVQRTADLLERIQDEVDRLAHSVFNIKAERRDSSRRFDVLLRQTGKEGDIVSRVLESVTSLERTLHFLRDALRHENVENQIAKRIKTVQRDIQSLMEHNRFLTHRIGFLLEATLGMIATEQNQVIKMFSVIAVVLLPPTLIASIYGMNFEYMPELKWTLGYPFALVLMVLSAVLPYWYFRRKGWF